MLRVLFSLYLIGKFFVAFIIVYILNGCVPAGIVQAMKPQANNDNPHVVCPNGVQGYLHASSRMDSVGAKKEHVEIHCK